MFSFSLTKNSDILSQWRGYAETGGVSIGFSTKELKKTADAHGFKLAKCIYEEKVKEKLIDEYLENFFNSINMTEIEKRNSQSEETMEKTIHFALIRHFFELFARFKHNSFEEEDEWRIISDLGGVIKQSKEYKVRQGLIPYYELPINLKNDIKNITTSPGSESIRKAFAIRKLFASQDISEIKVIISNSPFRNYKSL